MTKTKVKQTKREKGKVLSVLQNIGKSLVFPIAVLPAAALLLRIGAAIEAEGLVDGNGGQLFVYWLGFIIKTPGAIVFDNLPMIFAVGVAFGFAKDHRGEAALTGLLIYMGIVAMAQTEGSFTSLVYGDVMVKSGVDSSGKAVAYSELLYLVIDVKGVLYQTWLLNLGVFGGIASGLLAAVIYNKYSDVRLPAALGFFSGRRFVPMVAIISSAGVGMIIAVVWPWIQLGLVKMSMGLVQAPEVGAGVYAFTNRLLIPFGLHQIMNTFFWFQVPIVGDGGQLLMLNDKNVFVPLLGDINAFLASNSTTVFSLNGVDKLTSLEAFEELKSANVGMFQTGYFPIMMFGLPAVGMAMIKNADKDERQKTMAFVLSAGAVSFLTGITEPLEFAFMFVAPALYVGYAVLSGITASITVLTGASFGFGFSAGAIDLFLSLPNSSNLAQGAASFGNGYGGIMWIFIMGIAVFPIYFVMADLTIRMTNPATIGRTAIKNFKRPGIVETTKSILDFTPRVVDKKDKLDDGVDVPMPKGKKAKNAKLEQMAKDTIKLVGKANITNIDNCITRVRLTLKSNKGITQAQAKKIGYTGVALVGSKAAQFIIGPDSEVIANYMRELIKK